MSSVMDPEPAQTKVKVLLLYQGDAASEPRDMIREHLSTRKDFEPALVRDGSGSIDNTAFMEMKRLVKECHAAIALLTPDKRPASAAGNMWFEIGYWLATKPEDSLVVLKLLEKKEGHEQEPPDAEPMLISNLMGRNYVSIQKERWLEGVAEFLDKMRDRVRPRRPSDNKDKEERVFERVFKSFPGLPSLADCARCKTLTEPCPFRQDALVLTAELISVNEMYQKHLEAQDLFRRIAFHSTVLVEFADYNTPGMKKYREEYICALAADFTEAASDLLVVLGSDMGHWERFLAARIVHHYQYRDKAGFRLLATSRFEKARTVYGVRPIDLKWRYENMVNEVTKDVRRYFEWAEQFLRYANKDPTLLDNAFDRYLELGKAAFMSPERQVIDKDNYEFWCSRMQMLSMFAKSISDALSGWALHFFSECHERIVQAEKDTDTGAFDSILGKFVEALPHSQRNDCPYERSWVDEED